MSCSTKKAGFTNKLYHNTTAHYNVWWNGNESLKEAEKILEKDAKDDYTQILPVYKIGTKQEALKVTPQLDRALEKGTKGIKKHSININGVEHVDYIAHCYLLIVKSQFYKQEYNNAAFTSQYLISQFKTTKQAYEGMIWYARSMTQLKEYISAETMLDRVNADLESGKAPSSIEKLLYSAYAECVLAQEKYKIAVDYLKLAIDETSSNKQKSRWNYILGQIYQDQEKLNTAYKYYELSTKKNSNYEMLFNARINMALSVTTKGGRNESVLKTLQNMLKDKKNEEYLDQVYYAIGEVYMTSQDATKAIENWQKSVEHSANNRSQRIKSSLRLGNTYTDLMEDYLNGFIYYDTILPILKEEDKNYKEVVNKHSLLKSLAENIQVLNRADSLLAWADMPEEERSKKIEKIIEELKIEEQKRKEAELEEMIKATVQEQTNTLKGNWYFYNTNTVNQGKEAFMKQWGFRGLEDNWFMTSRQSVALNFGTPETPPDQDMELEEGEVSGKKDEEENLQASGDDKFSPAYYLKDVPRTQEERDSLHADIAKSLLLLGFIFNEGVNNPNKAIESFLRLAEEYQGTDYALPAYYQLYLIYDREGNTPNANYYRTLILKGFPDSDYANLIRDKDYYQELLAREKAAEKEYSQIYSNYSEGNYDEVILLSEAAVLNYPDPDLIPKYRYWEAFAYGRNNNLDTMISVLEGIVSDYPNHEIIPIIKSQLELLKTNGLNYFTESKSLLADKSRNEKDESEVKRTTLEGAAEGKDSPLPPESELYRYREKIPHYVVIILNDNKVNGTQLSYKVSDFNGEYFSTNNLKTSVLLFSQNLEMINIERFPDAKKAMEYFEFIQQPEGPLNGLNTEDFQIFAVSVQNYMTFYSQRDISAYEKFFRKFYF